MENLKNNWLIIVIAVGLSVAAMVWFGSSKDKQIAGNGGDVTNYMAVWGPFTVKGSFVKGNTNSTSTTATTYTLLAQDIENYTSVVLTPNTGDLALTLPATSTLSSTYLATAGDWTEQCWVNSTTTAGIDITFVTGTGYVLQSASTTDSIGTPTIGPGDMGCFKYIRDKSSASTFNIIAAFTRYVDAD